MIRQIVAENIAALRDAKYSANLTVTDRNRALATAADTTLSQIQRIINKELGTSIDLIQAMAKVFGCSPSDLLTPYYGNNRHLRYTDTEAERGILQRHAS